MQHRFIADKADIRLDRYLVSLLPDLSRTYIQKLIDEGKVDVNGRKAKPGLKLAKGDEVVISIPEPVVTTLSAEDIALKILYEDDDILVVDKPAGLTVYPAAGHPSHTLINAILSHFPALTEMDETVRPGIVHRLDKDTSGVMIVAKNNAARLKMAAQFSVHTVTKIYKVLVKGQLKPEEGVIEAPIGRDVRNRKKMAVVASGRPARTQYKVTKYIDGYTLLEVRIETGRTHQIRVHFNAIGFPVVGDSTYGVKSPFLSRQFLHAYRLGFRLPSSGEYVEFTSDLPDDLKQTLEEIS
jgi:23S rRNA pseudouridine1911/1915/1917 synthase